MQRENKDHLTNEMLGGKFKSQFMLVNYAIKLADNMIRSGRPPRVKKNDTQNPAALVLEEILQGKDQLVEIPEAKSAFFEGFVPREKVEMMSSPKGSEERKKTRRLL